MKSKKITLIDILIIILVLVALGIVYLKFKPSDILKTNKVRYTVLVKEQSEEMVESFCPEDDVILDTTTDTRGNVVDVYSEDAVEEAYSLNQNKYVLSDIPNKKDVYFTIECAAKENGWGNDIGEKHIRVGERQTISGKKYAVTGFIVEIEK